MTQITSIESIAVTPLAGLAKLREPFPSHQISKLPKPTKQQTDEVKSNFKAGERCSICGGWHHPKVVHLDYVGHAALTDRLLDADPAWSWDPVAIEDNGSPKLDKDGGMWIRLTVCGVTRLGYGDAQDKTGSNAMKERIGDALRNAAMRFGAALELWHKGVLHYDDPQEDAPIAKPPKDAGPKLYAAEQFAKNLPAWEKLILSGKKTAAQIIATVSSKAVLSDKQKATINSVKPNKETGETTSLLDDVKRICAAAVAIKDSETAFLRLDDARILLPEMNAENKALAVKEIDAVNESIKGREQK